MSHDHSRKSRLAKVLLLIFAFVMIMGPGPGLYLINPDSSDPDTVRTVLGMPIVYVWAVGWFFAQLTIVLIAYFKLWSRDEGDAAGEPPARPADGPSGP